MKIAAYGRVSTLAQVEQETERLKQAGADEVLIDSTTGTGANQPELQRLLASVEQGEVSTIIVSRFDRLGRDLVKFQTHLSGSKKASCQIAITRTIRAY